MVKSIVDATKLIEAISDYSQPLCVFACEVPEVWTDFNGHMNEAHYLECFSNASDAIMQLIGCDGAYIDGGKSFFTVETHIRHLNEALEGEPIFVTTQVLNASGKKLHLFHCLYRGKSDALGSELLASGEQMLLHVDLETRRVCEPEGKLADRLENIGEAHKHLKWPEGAGRAIRR